MDERAKRISEAITKSGLSYPELEKITGISKSSLQRYATGVTKKIPINSIESIAQATGTDARYLMGWEDTNTTQPNLTTVTPVNFELANAPISMKRIAVIGEVAAGYQCLADMQVIDYVACDASLLHTGYEYVYLRVRGDSMEPELHEGDLVLVQVQDTIESGEYAVVLVDDEDGLVKKIEIDRTHITLISENPYYPPRRFDREEMNRIRIFGKVVSVMRRM